MDQTREAYDRAKDSLEATVDTMARSFDALSQGAAALNRKVIEIAQENVSSGFDLAKSLATARTLAEMVELRADYWRKQLSALSAQAEEVRALSTKVAADMAAPIKAHVTRGIEQLQVRILLLMPSLMPNPDNFLMLTTNVVNVCLWH